jgi:adenosyl cobinamide kinase/adenosyl cobinamide phosphate guanylyltransferase
MSPDVLLRLGPRSCGKSEQLELALLTVPRRAYVGTLWPSPSYDPIIIRHRVRRGQGWDLVECSGSLLDDLNRLNEVLQEFGPSAACLIDGLTMWAANLARAGGDLLASARNLAEGVVELVEHHTTTSWRLVDVTPQTFEAEGFSLHAHAAHLLHRTLVDYVRGLVLEEWSNAEEI